MTEYELEEMRLRGDQGIRDPEAPREGFMPDDKPEREEEDPGEELNDREWESPEESVGNGG